MALTVVVAYDISDDRSRLRVAKRLQEWGHRVQKSMYVCKLEGAMLKTLQKDLLRMIDDETDSICFFRQCGTCWERADWLGVEVHEEDPECWIIM